jgi:hypothetical protein
VILSVANRAPRSAPSVPFRFTLSVVPNPHSLTGSAVCTRRDFVLFTLLAGTAVMPPRAGMAQSAKPRAVNFSLGLLESAESAPAVRRGFELGTHEALRTAHLFGGTLARYTGTSVGALAASGCTVIVSAVADARRAADAQVESSRRAVAYLNAAAGGDSLRSEKCGDLAFHVAPSDSMRESAAAGTTTSPIAWDPGLVRFGAEQLNDRFTHRYGAGMTEGAWCGWIAAKIAWEAALRARTVSASDIRDALLHPDAGFDGHKGRALRFNSIDRQLYQPLYAAGDLRVLSVVQPSPAHGRGACGR